MQYAPIGVPIDIEGDRGRQAAHVVEGSRRHIKHVAGIYGDLPVLRKAHIVRLLGVHIKPPSTAAPTIRSLTRRQDRERLRAVDLEEEIMAK